MFLRTFPIIRRRVTVTSTTETFEPFTGWHHSLEVLTAIQTVLNLASKTGNFQCRLGIQTATATLDDVNTPLNPTSVANQITTAPTRSLLRFDPNGANDGNIDTAAFFRFGVLYSLSGAGNPAQGDVELSGLCWR